MSSPVMCSLIDVIETSTEKWQCLPSEYENLKEYYSKTHDESLNGYDNWFNAHFHIMTSEEIKLREENIQKRKKCLEELAELRNELWEIEKRKKDIKVRMSVLKSFSDNLLAKINGEDS